MSLIVWLAIAVVAGTVYGIYRGWDVRLVLFLAALILGSASGDPTPILRVFLDTFSSEKFVIPICSAMGFAYTLRHTGCDRHLVRLLMRPVQWVPGALIPGIIVVAFTVNIPVISQTSTAVCVGPVAIPLMRAAGYSNPTIAACLCLGASIGGELLNPGAPELITVSEKTKVDTTTLARQFIPPLLVPYVLVGTLVFWLQTRVFDDRSSRHETSTATHEAINLFKAMVPLVPLVLLFLTGPPLNVIRIPQAWFANSAESFGTRLIGLAMLVGVAVAAIVSPQQAKDCAKTFFDGAGYGFTHIVSLIVTATCFAESLKQCGVAAAVGQLIAFMPDLLTPLAALVPFGFAFISGSGMASTKGLYTFFHEPAVSLGHNPSAVGAVVSVGSAAGRTMSPVAAVVLMCGTLTDVSPAAIIKRLVAPLLSGLVAMVVCRMLGLV